MDTVLHRSRRRLWDNALRFVNLIEAAPSGLPAPEICPKPNGTISFEWETPRVEAYIEIGTLGTVVS